MSASSPAGLDPASGEARRVVLDGERIARLEGVELPGELWMSAGLVDLQVNGYGGVDFNAPGFSREAGERLASILLSLGVTSFLPTVITANPNVMCERLAAIVEARAVSVRLTRMIPCLHVEGPFISPADGPRGAHPATDVRAPSIAEIERWQEVTGGLIGLVTLSPHWAEAPSFTRLLVKRGIRVAIGHTDATPEQIEAVVDAGATLSTHLGNGVAATLPRHPNLLWAQLAEDRLSATFIADGHHLPAATLRSMMRAKGAPRRLLVSDTVALGGMQPGCYTQPIGGTVELDAAGRLSLAGTPYLAGAALPLHVGVANAVLDGGVTLAEALEMASARPGLFAAERGRLQPGTRADVVVFAHREGARALDIRETWLAGVQEFGA